MLVHLLKNVGNENIVLGKEKMLVSPLTVYLLVSNTSLGLFLSVFQHDKGQCMNEVRVFFMWGFQLWKKNDNVFFH